ncbi:CapA family protein [Manganibacter manganicus]|uniref:Metallophosphatase n=1 Tax=Manganibacter manganicus TaxID=1873176 RepID=A0A1V8RUP6_9HYPH|nr:CapA family protein [Pseudaminobacter manganicus]OQM76885.1 metallophosphatase [Pseudaminobacter manganicus]
MSNYPLAYKLSWLPRFLRPSLDGNPGDFAPAAATIARPLTIQARLAFVGDISAVANRRPPKVDPAIRDLLASADLVIGNCESPVVNRTRARWGTFIGTRHAMREGFLAGSLAAAGIVREKLVLSIANNHALDQGADGFSQTLAALDRLGISVVGKADSGIVTRQVGLLAIGFAAFTQWRNGAAADFAGKVAMSLDPSGMPGCGGAVDMLCVLPHWDWEFRHFPRTESRVLARRFAEHGASLIVGGHAHVVQPVEMIGGAMVAYGLGDFLGTAFARQPWPGRIGAILVVDVCASEGLCAKIAAYRMQFFYRMRDGDHERLLPIEALEGSLRQRVVTRLSAIYGAGLTEAQFHADNSDDEQKGDSIGQDQRP